MTTTDLAAAAAFNVEEAGLACGNLDEQMGFLAPCFARVEPRRQARKYITGLRSDVPGKNCWALAEQAGDAAPARTELGSRLAAQSTGPGAGAPARPTSNSLR